MSRILVFKCDKCGALIENEIDYKSHVRKEAAELRAWRKSEQKRQEWIDFLAKVKLCSSFSAIEEWFVANGEQIIKKCIKDRHYGPRWKAGDGILSMKFTRMTWSENCSNTHSSPPGKPTNWHCDKNLSLGYPGWTGYVQVQMSEKLTFGSDVFDGTIIHTGCGNGHGNGLSEYQVTIFAEEALALFTMEKLKGNLNVRT